jgi:tripartite-type tricarboxylate transporter receptor subunit TctC
MRASVWASRALFVAAAVFAFAGAQADEAWPAHPVKIVSPYPPGGTTDILARLLAKKLEGRLGQNVIVENRAGAAGNIGTDYVAKSRPDGYTFLLAASGPIVIAGTLYPKLPYNPATDLAPVAPLARVPFILVVNAKSGLDSIADVLKRGKEGNLSFGSAGSGSPQHIIGEMFNIAAKTHIQHIPYKGSGPLVTDLVGGQVPMAFDSAVSMMPQVKAGTVKVLAVTSAHRSPVLPDIPTLAEAGVPGIDAQPWYGLMEPAGVPAEITKRMNAEVENFLQDPEVKERLASFAAEPVLMTPTQFKGLIDAEIVRWGAAVKASGAKVD